MSEICYVYIIKAEGGAYKVGVASDPQKRHKRLKTAIPYPSTLLHTIPCTSRSNAFALEKSLHTRLSEYHTVGEWFTPPKDVIYDIMMDGGHLKPSKSAAPSIPVSSPKPHPKREISGVIESGDFAGWDLVKMKHPPKEEILEIFHQVSNVCRRRPRLDLILERASWRGMKPDQVNQIVSDLKSERKIIEIRPGLFRFP